MRMYLDKLIIFYKNGNFFLQNNAGGLVTFLKSAGADSVNSSLAKQTGSER